MGSKNGSKIYSAGTLCSVESPYALDGVGIHIHCLGTIAPARCNGKSDIDAFFLELLCAGSALANTADRGIGNNHLDRCAVAVAKVFFIELFGLESHAHGLLLKRSSYIERSFTTINYRADTDYRTAADEFSAVTHFEFTSIKNNKSTHAGRIEMHLKRPVY